MSEEEEEEEDEGKSRPVDARIYTRSEAGSGRGHVHSCLSALNKPVTCQRSDWETERPRDAYDDSESHRRTVIVFQQYTALFNSELRLNKS